MTLLSASPLIAILFIIALLIGYFVGHYFGRRVGYLMGENDTRVYVTAKIISIKYGAILYARAFQAEFGHLHGVALRRIWAKRGLSKLSQPQEDQAMTPRRVTPGIPPSAPLATQGGLLSRQ